MESTSHARRTWTFEDSELDKTVYYGDGDGRVNTTGKVLGPVEQIALKVEEDEFSPRSVLFGLSGVFGRELSMLRSRTRSPRPHI